MFRLVLRIPEWQEQETEKEKATPFRSSQRALAVLCDYPNGISQRNEAIIREHLGHHRLLDLI